jgi:hypothetical protein
MTDKSCKSGGQAGMVKGGNWGSQDGKPALAKGPNKPATPNSGVHASNPHVGNGKGGRIKGGTFVGV